jgi:hypothetical protein
MASQDIVRGHFPCADEDDDGLDSDMEGVVLHPRHIGVTTRSTTICEAAGKFKFGKTREENQTQSLIRSLVLQGWESSFRFVLTD